MIICFSQAVLLPYLLKTAPPLIKRHPQVKFLIISVSTLSIALLNDNRELGSGRRSVLLFLITPPPSPCSELSPLLAPYIGVESRGGRKVSLSFPCMVSTPVQDRTGIVQGLDFPLPLLERRPHEKKHVFLSKTHFCACHHDNELFIRLQM